MIRPVLADIAGSWPSALQSRADVGGAAVLPDDGAMHGLPGGAVPHDGGLALVGDADRGDVLCREAGLLQRLAAGRRRSRSRCPPARARPSPRPENAAGIPAARMAAIEMSLRNTIAREDVVPWSMASTKDMAFFPALLPGDLLLSAQRGKRIGERRSIYWRRRAIPPFRGEGRRVDGLTFRVSCFHQLSWWFPAFAGDETKIQTCARARRCSERGDEKTTPMRWSRRRRRRWSGRS